MANVGTGNFIVQADDVTIKERGIDLAFRRTFNSQSQHNASNSDGAGYGVYGNGWTNPYDAHIGYTAQTNTISVYDIDGERCDWSASGQGAWIPCAGHQGETLAWDGGCGYAWTKKNGTLYEFWEPFAACGTPPGYWGRLAGIFSRNKNNYIVLGYTWKTTAPSMEDIASITVQHVDGHALVMNFASVAGNTELSSITRPDGAVITYQYDSLGNLIEVNRPGNNSASVIPETYQVIGGKMANITSPRWVLSYWATGGAPTDGDYLTLGYSGNAISQIYESGTMNFIPNDGTSTPLQPTIATGQTTWRSTTFSGWGSGVTTMTDSDGHATNWTTDGAYRVTQEAEYNGSQYLVDSSAWNAANELTAEVNPNGRETDYAHDTNGNLVAAAMPQVASSNGTFRPTVLASYDAFNNVTASCDPNASNALGLNWTGSGPTPTDSLCPSTSTLANRVNYSYPSYEPFGEVAQTFGPATNSNPSGYRQDYYYSPSAQGGIDYGLATSIIGSSTSSAGSAISQFNGTFSYDIYGNLIQSSNGVGTISLAYDSLNRLIAATDADGYASHQSYFADGSVSSTATAAQQAANLPVTYTYDADGDETSVTHQFGNIAGTTTKWYDGADRLVEAEEPKDKNDYFTYPWLTRHVYDLTAGGTVSMTGSPAFYAHGNEFKMQRYVGADTSSQSSWSGTGWTDISGSAYDPLDRETAAYKVTPASSIVAETLSTATWTYDAPGYLGLLSYTTSPVGDVDNFAYDTLNRVTGESFSNSNTPARTYEFDADDRQTTISEAGIGAESYAYDHDGSLVAKSEAAGGTQTDPVNIQYTYYPDGTKAAVTINPLSGGAEPPGFVAFQPVKQYAYRTDGKLSSADFTFSGTTSAFQFTYTPGGRSLTRSDPYASNSYAYTYDAYGRLGSLTMPLASWTSITNDVEDEPLTLNAYGTTETVTYSTRGELLGEAYGSDSCINNNSTPGAWHLSKSANGFLLKAQVSQQPSGGGGLVFCGTYATQFDHNLGTVTSLGSGVVPGWLGVYAFT